MSKEKTLYPVPLLLTVVVLLCSGCKSRNTNIGTNEPKQEIVHFNQIKYLPKEQFIQMFGFDPDTVDWERSRKEIQEYLNADVQTRYKQIAKGQEEYSNKRRRGK